MIIKLFYKRLFAAFLICILMSLFTAKFAQEPSSLFQNEKNESVTAFPLIFSAEKNSATLKEPQNGFIKKFKLFGVIPFKEVAVTLVEDKYLIPSGQTFGVKFFTKGVMVVGMSDIKTEKGNENPAFNSGIRVKDIVLSINNEEVNTTEQVSQIIERNGEKELIFKIKRNNSFFDAKVSPKKSVRDNLFKIGLWVRDSTAGIGTITYIDPKTADFGGLGHGICDVDTGELMPLSKATVYKANINDVKRGYDGVVGELRGMFVEDFHFGTLSQNNEEGIFGTLSDQKFENEGFKVGYKQEIKEGNAFIICTTDESGPQKYSISILKVFRNDKNSTKNMLIKVTDEKLLKKTGGIVQGMSGSPIIQNDKIIGAVTHVLINDPTKGFGVFIENMLMANGKIKKAA